MLGGGAMVDLAQLGGVKRGGGGGRERRSRRFGKGVKF